MEPDDAVSFKIDYMTTENSIEISRVASKVFEGKINNLRQRMLTFLKLKEHFYWVVVPLEL